MIINQTQEDKITCYSFEANNTNYDVMTSDGISFDVWSSRKGFSAAPTIKCYDTLSEMAKRSKALSNLAKLISH